MISGFIKKLLYTNQFQVFKGKTSILETPYTILPLEALVLLEKREPKLCYSLMKKAAFEHAGILMKKTGFKGKQAFSLLMESFDVFGIGELQVIELDEKQCKGRVKLLDSAYLKEAAKLKIAAKHSVTSGTLAGFFSYYLSHNVDVSHESSEGNTAFFVVKKAKIDKLEGEGDELWLKGFLLA